MNRQKGVLIVGVLLILGNVFFAVNYSIAKKELNETNRSLASQDMNEKVLNFTQMFVEKILKSKTEVDFETRLELENTVRELNDEEILNEWKNFIESSSEVEAQEGVKNLLGTLINKVSV